MHLDTLSRSTPIGADGPMDLDAVRVVSAAHLFIYFAPETTEEAAGLGVTDRGPAYLAFRSAVALWQQITVAREWRGDAHLVVLAASGLGPCDCLVLDTATGVLPKALVRATRQWDDEEWSTATARLVARGWLDSHGVLTDAGSAARERIEVETDEHCAALWAPIGNAGAAASRRS